MHPRMVMHPMQPKLNGKDLTENKDPNGKRLFIEFVDTVKKHGAGIVAYEWPKPGATQPLPKMSYVAGFAPWNWVIGTGLYVDNLKEQIWDALSRALMIFGIVIALTGGIAVLVGHKISRAMRGMTSAMNELAAGNFDVVMPGLGREDEIGDMAASVEAFKVKAVEKARLEAEAETERRRARRRVAQGRDDRARRRFRIHGRRDRRHGVVGIEPTRSRRQFADQDGGEYPEPVGRGGRHLGRSLRQCAIGGERDRRDVGLGARDRPAGAGIERHRQARRCSRPRRPTRASMNCRRPRRGSATWST